MDKITHARLHALALDGLEQLLENGNPQAIFFFLREYSPGCQTKSNGAPVLASYDDYSKAGQDLLRDAK